MDHLFAMRVFARVAEAGTFSRAAALLHVPRARATKIVQQLERHLKATLVQRTTRRVTLTREGRGYYRRIARVLCDVEDIEFEFSKSRGLSGGALRLYIGAAVAREILVPALPSLLAQHPALRLDLGITDRMADLFAEGVDCAIVCGMPSQPHAVARRLAWVESVLCASPSYLKKHGSPRHPRDLAGSHWTVACARPPTGEVVPLVLVSRRERFKLHPVPVISVDNGDVQIAAGVAGLGIISPYRFAARTALACGSLVAVLPEWRVERTAVYAIYPSSRYPSDRVRAFIAWAARAFAAVH